MNARRIIVAKKGSLTKDEIKKLEKNFSVVVQCEPDDIKVISTLYDGETTRFIQAVMKKIGSVCGPEMAGHIYWTMLNELTKPVETQSKSI